MSNFDKVLSSLRYLDLHPNINEYNWRYLIQKITYLNQALGMDTNYNFTIYVSGPYSSALARDYYTQSEKFGIHEPIYQLNRRDIERLDKIKKCCGILENSSLMEAASTSVFLIRAGLDNDDILLRKIRSIKPHLSYENVILGLSRAKELLFQAEYLTEALKEESDLLDSIKG